MPPLHTLFEWAAVAVEVAGVLLLLFGLIASLVHCGLAFGNPATRTTAYETLRRNLGRTLLLSLEFLVAADIIYTLAVEPTFYSLGVLAVLVAIRTFLSFALEVEVEGRWPWQRHPPGTPVPPDESI